MDFLPIAWSLLLLGVVAAVGSAVAARKRWPRAHFALLGTAIGLIAGACAALVLER